MTKIFFLSLICVFCLSTPLELMGSATNTAEFKVAAFFPQGKKFRSIYGDTSVDYQLSGSFALNCNFEVWGEIDYLTDSIKRDCYKTRVQILNPSMGIQYVHSFLCNVDGYIGTGISIPIIHLKNDSCCSYQDLTKVAWGSLSKLGVRYWFCKSFFLNIFVDYLYADVHFRKHQNIGGVKTGLGIGTRF